MSCGDTMGKEGSQKLLPTGFSTCGEQFWDPSLEVPAELQNSVIHFSKGLAGPEEWDSMAYG